MPATSILPMMKRVIVLLFKHIGKFLTKVFTAILDGQQDKADHAIADMLHKTEYRNCSYNEVLCIVQGRNINNV